MRRFLKFIGAMTGLFIIGAGGYLFLATRHLDKIFNPDRSPDRSRDKV